uniref:Uncharacterized protein n=1 Tax=Spongospora subterranea TaxID=70186 RepID=A0A0H5RUA6_9EUKA|eukprot:CRZ12304.1 hypothetical protein [Spongospora subterranea]
MVMNDAMVTVMSDDDDEWSLPVWPIPRSADRIVMMEMALRDQGVVRGCRPGPDPECPWLSRAAAIPAPTRVLSQSPISHSTIVVVSANPSRRRPHNSDYGGLLMELLMGSDHGARRPQNTDRLIEPVQQRLAIRRLS